jgi:hypothetical protein
MEIYPINQVKKVYFGLRLGKPANTYKASDSELGILKTGLFLLTRGSNMKKSNLKKYGPLSGGSKRHLKVWESLSFFQRKKPNKMQTRSLVMSSSCPNQT